MSCEKIRPQKFRFMYLRFDVEIKIGCKQAAGFVGSHSTVYLIWL